MILINNLLLIIAFFLSNVLLLFSLGKIIKQDVMTNDLLFIYLSNLILLVSNIIFFFILDKLMISFYISLFLMIFSYMLIFNIKDCLKSYQLFSLPYFVVCVVNFAYMLILYLF